MSGQASAGAPRTFEEIEVGMSASLTRSFTKADIAAFADLAPDRAPVHADEEFARGLGYGDVLVFGWLAAAPFSGLLGMTLPGANTVLHWVKITMAAPVYPGDEITYRVDVKQLSRAAKAVILDLTATRAGGEEIVIRGQAQCGFRN